MQFWSSMYIVAAITSKAEINVFRKKIFEWYGAWRGPVLRSEEFSFKTLNLVWGNRTTNSNCYILHYLTTVCIVFVVILSLSPFYFNSFFSKMQLGNSYIKNFSYRDKFHTDYIFGKNDRIQMGCADCN